jgi:purine-binding chemotaxis protein CheW
MSTPALDARVAQLRRDFDAAFASPLREPQRAGTDLLIVGACGVPYALRASELAGLEVDRKVVPLPAARRGLLGLCAAQGNLIPVFALAALLGTPLSGAPPRWIALHREKELVALAFDELRDYRRVTSGELGAPHAAPAAGSFTRESLRLDGTFIHVLDIPALVASVRRDEPAR